MYRFATSLFYIKSKNFVAVIIQIKVTKGQDISQKGGEEDEQQQLQKKTS